MTRLFRSILTITLLTLIATFCFAQDSSGVSCVYRHSFWNYTYQVAVQGHYAYIADGSSGLRILDITRPDSLVEVGYFTDIHHGIAQGVAVRDTLAFVAFDEYDPFCQIISIADPVHPRLLGRVLHDGMVDPNFGGIIFSGNYVILSNGGADIIDISDPTAPTQVPWQGSYSYAATVVNNRLYVVEDSLRIFDFTHPDSIVQLGSCQIIASGAYSVLVSGNYAYVGASSRFRTYDISNPAAPIAVDSINDDYIGEANKIIQRNDTLFVNTPYGFYVFSIANPAHPQQLYHLQMGGNSMAISGNVVFNCERQFGFYANDISNLSSPVTYPNYPSTGAEHMVQRVAVSGHYAYYSDFYDGLLITDFSNPDAPRDTIYHAPGISAFAIHDSIGYLWCWSGLYLMNITNPFHPVAYGTIDNFGFTDHLTFSGNRAYGLHNTNSGSYPSFRIWDATNSATPTIIGNCTINANLYDVAYNGNLAFVAADSLGLKIVDFSQPDSMRVVGTYSRGYNIYSVTVSGNYVFVADTVGLMVVDVTEPAAPILISTMTFPYRYINHLRASGNYLFLDAFHGIRVINTSTPNALQEVGYYDNILGSMDDMAIAGNYIFTAEYNFGCIYDCSQFLSVVDRASSSVPEHFSLKQNFPNPFNSSTTIEYTIPKYGKVEMKLYDITGRAVGTLVNFNQNPGTFRVKLDGTKLSSGIYFCRLNAGGMTQTTKLTLLK